MSLCPHGYTAFWDCPICEEPMGVKVSVSKKWCLEMALREGELEVGAGARHDYMLHETIEALVRCTLCGEQVRQALARAASGPSQEGISGS